MNKESLPKDYFEPSHEKTVEDVACEYEDSEIVSIELTVEEIGILALKAHNLNMTLNDFMVGILVDHANQTIAEHEQVSE